MTSISPTLIKAWSESPTAEGIERYPLISRVRGSIPRAGNLRKFMERLERMSGDNECWYTESEFGHNLI